MNVPLILVTRRNRWLTGSNRRSLVLLGSFHSTASVRAIYKKRLRITQMTGVVDFSHKRMHRFFSGMILTVVGKRDSEMLRRLTPI